MIKPSKNTETALGTEDENAIIPAPDDQMNEVLVALRRIIRSVDIHAKQVTRKYGLTPAQILIMRAIRNLGEVTSGRLADEVNLSLATVTTILDRLEKRGFVERYRSKTDRRVVHTKLTKDGAKASKNAPALLHEQFIQAYEELSSKEQDRIRRSLTDVADMLGSHRVDEAPILDVLSV